jgi:hypothetical protein
MNRAGANSQCACPVINLSEAEDKSACRNGNTFTAVEPSH